MELLANIPNVPVFIENVKVCYNNFILSTFIYLLATALNIVVSNSILLCCELIRYVIIYTLSMPTLIYHWFSFQ